ncbi:similar to Saccharomyces cerevisiae YDL035C GPR1 Plasma membrane G protein coupled receptor (GPCR) that interacts with the heterotrimeric G protein alpha subunit, Gpa2p, and with Plc1p [Maudiozyma saulgeensis]|uniref:Similar to Saccharomyces cerevisiae YDL035C GPR1 Plasma membrane G protein coupled receptor (GPCR) that interacts with the heterotrimeric G protein alpha subunit, Gpa2p, and with Plc1p n=1 Tax=Maudiozyma saulgeensis TaxID=1789683 RepID=A0A1X7R3H0_9SACH|nr:similar to Saccharomyces cerevisiae YDL035C GPR1 Plasma membrane G protein coupled receptor (GPCR) that interacts with the heterotrimeric G protein alpha subunit, Gpa2p, and with Plc1p [Kazachstania saulgeensis]
MILNTTTVNVALGLPGMTSTFNGFQLIRMRVLAIVAASSSIVAGLVGMHYLMLADRRKRMFRHEMILFLIVCDFIKALVLVIYPVVILIDEYHYSNPVFFNILGWFTAFSIEGADFAIIFVAVHFALLIFKPNWRWKNKRTGNLEGGLYKYKFIIWPVTFIVPSVMASLVFIDYNVINYDMVTDKVRIIQDNNNYDFKFEPRRGGYKPWSAWCYLPPKPLWYKYVLSWGLRYVLILSIFGIYFAIYIYVMQETKRIRKQLGDFNPNDKNGSGPRKIRKKRPFWQKILYVPFIKLWDLVMGFFSLSIVDQMSSDSDSDSKSLGMDFIKKPIHNKHMHNDENDADGDNNGNYHQVGQGSNKHNIDTITNSYSLTDQIIFPDSLRNERITSNNTTTGDIPNSQSHGSAPSTPFRSDHDSYEMTNMTPPNDARTNSDINKEVDLTGVRLSFQRETYNKMKRRRMQVQKNLRFIFIYPFSYLVIWSFPIASDISQTRHEVVHGPIVWLTYVDTFIRPLSCLIHTFVFILREKPWNLAWNIVERSFLFDEYKGRGKMTEEKIMALCNSDLGRRGWYYRGRWSKLSCWKHQPQFWKRALWYIGITIKGIFQFKIVYHDNCNDTEYWNRYYFAEESSNISTTNSHGNQGDMESPNPKQSTRPETIVSFSTNTSNGMNNQESHQDKFTINVPWYWRVFHYFPMLHGIDLDELNRSLYLNYESDTELMGPGFELALNKLAKSNHSNTSENSQSQDNTSENPFNNIPTKNLSESFNHDSNNSIHSIHSSNYDANRNNASTALHFDEPTNFSKNSTIRRKRRDSRYDQDVLDEDLDGMDILTFLKGPGV